VLAYFDQLPADLFDLPSGTATTASGRHGIRETVMQAAKRVQTALRAPGERVS